MHCQLVRALTLAIVALGLGISGSSPASAVVDRDCGDFASQAGAQNFFLNAGGGDPHRLDDDGDASRAVQPVPVHRPRQDRRSSSRTGGTDARPAGTPVLPGDRQLRAVVVDRRHRPRPAARRG